MPQVVTLAKLLLVMPATNAVSERSFSAMKRVKTYLRATVSDTRMNNLMTLHVHKHRTDEIDTIKAANDFCKRSENRSQIFGRFTTYDILPKGPVKSISVQTEGSSNN